jgi:hypothetical protein
LEVLFHQLEASYISQAMLMAKRYLTLFLLKPRVAFSTFRKMLQGN